MLGALTGGFNALLEFFTTIGEAVVHFFDTLTKFFGFLSSSVSFLTSAVQYIPVPLLVFAAAGIAISAVFLVVGR